MDNLEIMSDVSMNYKKIKENSRNACKIEENFVSLPSVNDIINKKRYEDYAH